MMINQDLYCPYSVELIFDFFAKLKIDINKRHSTDDKKKVLEAIEVLLSQKIIYAGENKDGRFEKWNLTTSATLNRIDKIWIDGADFGDFYKMVWFGYEKWYIEALKKEGYGKERILWADFVEKNIGNLEKWIEKNKPN